METERTQPLLITSVDQRTGEKVDYVSPRDDRFILSKLDNKQVGKVQVSVVREQQAKRFARQVKKEMEDFNGNKSKIVNLVQNFGLVRDTP